MVNDLETDGRQWLTTGVPRDRGARRIGWGNGCSITGQVVPKSQC